MYSVARIITLTNLVLLTCFVEGFRSNQTGFFWKCETNFTQPLKRLEYSESNDNVPGRFNFKICLPSKFKEWELSLYYHNDRNSCNSSSPTVNRNLHSKVNVLINHTCESDNSAICALQSLDLIFSGCYEINSILTNLAGEQTMLSEKYMNIVNNITEEQFHIGGRIEIFPFNETYLHVTWKTSFIPITAFEVFIQYPNETNQRLQEYCSSCTCNTNPLIPKYDMECTMLKPEGNVSVVFNHLAPWMRGQVIPTDVTSSFTRIDPSQYRTSLPQVYQDDNINWVYYTVGGLICLVLLVFTIRYVRRSRRGKEKPTNKGGEVIRPSRKDSKELADVPVIGPQVLLVYASDVSTEGKALCEFLRSNGAKVKDIQSRAVTSQAAPAPAAWVRRTLAATHTKVVFLQSAYIGKDDSEEGVKSGLVRSCNDALVSLAARMMADSALELAYNKYFIVSLPSAPDYLQYTLDFTRFYLPEGAKLLLKYLGCNGDIKGYEQLHKTVIDWQF